MAKEIKYEHDGKHHSNHNHANTNKKKLLTSAVIIASFMFVEVVGGIMSGSLALISDAGHMLSDFAALTMAFVAAYVSQKAPDDKQTFGYSRFPILVAFSNALFMFAVIAWILYHSITRFFNPVEIMSTPMLIVAIIGFLINIVVFCILHFGDKDHHDLNVKSAALHVLGDLLGSVAAIIAALVVMFTGWTPIDPILSIFIALIIGYHSLPILKQTAHILMQGSPDHISEEEIQKDLIDKIKELNVVDHIHLWYQNDSQVMATMHVQVNNCIVFEDVKKQIREILIEDFKIHHVTIELEKH
tara:strand:+ start:34947 stop:35849 length:903 start_codon:yes stop_codon:yes gene_type:complete